MFTLRPYLLYNQGQSDQMQLLCILPQKQALEFCLMLIYFSYISALFLVEVVAAVAFAVFYT